jgi:hypothetical protein
MFGKKNSLKDWLKLIDLSQESTWYCIQHIFCVIIKNNVEADSDGSRYLEISASVYIETSLMGPVFHP